MEAGPTILVRKALSYPPLSSGISESRAGVWGTTLSHLGNIRTWNLLTSDLVSSNSQPWQEGWWQWEVRDAPTLGPAHQMA